MSNIATLSVHNPFEFYSNKLPVGLLSRKGSPISRKAVVSVHLDQAYDSLTTRRKLEARSLIGEISQKGKSAPVSATKRWIVECTNPWCNAHKKLVWCTERRGPVIDFSVTFSEVIIIVRRLIREG